MSYLNLYRSYHRAKKDFIVEFYKRYEGKGGYWNAVDEWVSGEAVHETVCEKHFDDLESALKFADEMQEEILKEERKRATGWKPEDIFWLSEFRINTNNSSKWDLIEAQINWGGSTYRMDMYMTIKEEHESVQIDPRKVKDCSKCPYSNPIQKQIPQSFDRVYNILCQKQNNALVGEMVNGVCRTGIPGSCPFLVEEKQEFKEPKFDPKTLRPFDKVLARYYPDKEWEVGLFSHPLVLHGEQGFVVNSNFRKYVIPYNETTEHLVGTADGEVPEVYRYWEIKI